jgi:hypothetical protein
MGCCNLKVNKPKSELILCVSDEVFSASSLEYLQVPILNLNQLIKEIRCFHLLFNPLIC